ncbi:MAG TPA: LytTR family DNA-binding domain-containing protein [Flavobacterium sp.]
MSRFSYVVLDHTPDYLLDRTAMESLFPQFKFVGSAGSYTEGLDLILDVKPDLVFLDIDSASADNGISLNLINELYRYLPTQPQVVITSRDKASAFQVIKFGVFDFLPKPLTTPDLRKCLMRFSMLQKSLVASETVPEYVSESVVAEDVLNEVDSAPETIAAEQFAEPSPIVYDKELKPLTICVKSYGDYRFIQADDICYLQADNNSTDLHLNNGEMITAFKTLKHFENVLNSPFIRIHNSYIVNIDYVSRIHTGNSVCYLKNSTIKLPFSKSYKENVDSILQSMANGNYLEI